MSASDHSHEPGSFRRHRARHGLWLLVPLVLLAAALVLLPSRAGAVHNLALFELDGNTTNDPAVTGDDWDSVFAGTSHAFSTKFVGLSTEGPSVDTTYFTGGGSKDTNDISQWQWSPTDVSPDKNQITDAYAATYVDPNSNHTIVYFGMDRYDTSGDSNVGFWFNQDGTFGINPNGTFTGLHKPGDLFVVSAFGNGGAMPDISLYKWTASGLTFVASGQGCTASPANDQACAAVNDASIAVPWAYQDKAGDAAKSVPANGFFEGGIDLNAIYTNNDVPCFSNFIGETRSSASTSAQLKDFAFGSVDSCGSIVITKTARPTAAGTTFPFTASGADASVGNFSLNGSNDGTANVKTFESIKPGSYTIAEGDLPTGWDFGGISCSKTDVAGSSTFAPSGKSVAITLALAGRVNCAFTNNRQPQLTLTKTVDNTYGGSAVASDFTLTATGTGGFSGNGPSTGAHLVNAGVAYTLSESGGPASGYQVGNWVCTGGGSQSGNQITLSTGDDVTCGITNTAKAPKLIVVKTVVNDNGGAKAAGDFTLNVSGTSPDPGSFPGSASGTTVTLHAGSYSVTEPSHDGYTMSASADCNGSIAIGEEKTCTITNDDVKPQLTVIKHVINDNGGTKSASDFSLSVSGSSPAPATFNGSESGTKVDLNAGSFSVTEGAHAGYDVSYSGDCNGTLAPGGSKTCTVTNDDIAPKLVVVKHVVNDNGGTKSAGDFTLNVTGSGPAPASFVGDEQGTTVTLGAGAYSVTEPSHDGYTMSPSADCTGSIAVGQTKTCTVTNDDIQPQLTVIKHVINDNGGTAKASDFTMTATGSSPSPASFPGSEAGTTVALNAGSYSVGENINAGYTASYSTDCNGTIAVGEHKTCTVTNDDNAATLIVEKHVINDNGGTAAAGDFALTVTGSSPSPATFNGSEAGTTVVLGAGSYSVAEPSHNGYSVSLSADCTGAIANGETKTCTVTNDDIQPQLTVIKHVINDNGGAAAASDFTLAVDATNASPASLPGSEAGTAVAADAGAYSVTEGAHAGYTATYSPDCTGTLSIGDKKTCTVTNDDQATHLTLAKRVVNDNGGTALPGEWTLNVKQDGKLVDAVSGNAEGQTIALAPGTYSLDESGGPSGYAQTSIVCDGEPATTITLALGGSATCTFTNDDVAPRLVVVKHVINNDGGTKASGDFTMSVSGTQVGPASFLGSESGTSVTLAAGSYSVGESGFSGYTATYSAACSGAIAVGQVKTCTVTNDDNAVPFTPPVVPPPPAPQIDLSVTKVGTPSPDILGRRITWTETITNNGPNAATGVKLSDVLPANATFISVATSQGSCAVTGGTLDCQIGSMAVGATVKVTIITTPTATGLQVNTVTVVGNEAETNTANNTATASVQVNGPFKPPVVKKSVCYAVSVAPNQLSVGKLSALEVLVTAAKKPVGGARVRLQGASILKLSGKTNRAGRTAVALQPKKPGILKVQAVAHKGCNNPRVGIIGVFTPPVTG